MNNTEGGKPPPATGLKHFLRSCKYSLRGLRAACRESAFRQELAFGAVLLPAAWLIPLDTLWSVLLTVCWLMLLTTELLNTAVEAVVDLVSPDYNELAGRAKDLGSVAVACAIIANLVAWTAAIITCFCQ